MKTIWVSRYYNGTADVFDEDHGPPSWPYVDAFEAKQRIAELEERCSPNGKICPSCGGQLDSVGISGSGTIYRCRECGTRWVISEYDGW